jgi:hypothetical protein
LPYFIFPYFHIWMLPYLYVCIFHICMFQQMQRAWTVCIPSGICFIEQKGIFLT